MVGWGLGWVLGVGFRGRVGRVGGGGGSAITKKFLFNGTADLADFDKSVIACRKKCIQ